MPRPRKGAHLWLRPERRERGRLVARSIWIIIDGREHVATGCLAEQAEAAERELAAHITAKYQPKRKIRDIEDIAIADVLSIYDEDCRERQANKRKFDERLTRLNDHWGAMKLSAVNGETCRAYVKARGNSGGARRDLEDLRSAINHHAKEGYHRGVVRIVLPEKGEPRDRWLTRKEAATLLRACWRAREVQTVHRGPLKGQRVETGKRPLRHLARFILIGLYTGTRAAAIATASPTREEGRSFVDLDQGVYYRLAQGKRRTKKRQPPVPIPPRLLAHLRRWADKGVAGSHFVEWHGKPVASVKTAFARAVKLAKLEGKISPHTLRHTAATWLMQQGVDKWQAAGFLGMSAELIDRVYGHHHPAHLHGAARAIGYRQKLVVSLVAERAKRNAAAQPVEKAGGPGRTRTSNQTVMSGVLGPAKPTKSVK